MSPQDRLEVSLRILQGLEGNADDRNTEWLRIFQHYHPRLRSFFAWRASSEDELEDHLGQIWARAFLFVGSLKSASALWSWLTTVGNNVFRDEQRRRRRRPILLESDAPVRDGTLEALIAGWTADVDEHERQAKEVAEILEALPAADREFLELYAIDGLSHDEIAIRVGLPSAAASRQRLKRLRARFQDNVRR